jgi:hypothetical protein
MFLQKVVSPLETGVQKIYNWVKELDSGFRRNDEKPHFLPSYEFINIRGNL